MKVGLAYPAFKKCFQAYFPDLINLYKDYKLVRECDLIIFSGGEDIDPAIYGQVNVSSYGINPERDNIERDIFSEAMGNGKKILGVCRGHQLINVLLGGTLTQNINPPHSNTHSLEVVRQYSIISMAYTSGIVNSLHHQGIIHAGRNLNVSSVYDKAIESCESEKIITVQFHPEFMPGEESNNFFKYIQLWVENYRAFRREAEELIERNKRIREERVVEQIKNFSKVYNSNSTTYYGSSTGDV